MTPEQCNHGYFAAALRFSPEWLATCFGEHVGQFYDRPRFDVLANLVRGVLTSREQPLGVTFREDLDELIERRGYPLVRWTCDESA